MTIAAVGAQERPVRVAYLVTHPIQYQAPLLKRIAAQPDISLKVFFQTDMSTKNFFDVGFGRRIEWDVPLLDGYEHEFLPALGRATGLSHWRPWSRGLLQRLRRGHFDVLWIHGYARPYNIVVALCAAAFLGLKVLIRDEATTVSAPRLGGRELFKRSLMKTFTALGARYLAIGTLNAEYYRQLGVPGERIFLVPYCVDNGFFREKSQAAAADRDALRREIGLEPGRPVVLYASKFSRRKRPDDLIAAFRQMSARFPADAAPYLLMIGDGEMKADLESESKRLGEDKIKYLGFRNQTELPRFFDLCDVFVLPSIHEPWGLVVNEAMNAAKAVVVTSDVGCGPDLVQDGVNGFIVPTRNPGVLAERLFDILGTPGRARAMGDASLAIVSAWNFDKDIEGLRAALQS